MNNDFLNCTAVRQKGQKFMKLKKTTALIAVLALCAGTMTACEDKSEELLRLVDSGDFKGAYDYYDEEIDGTNKEDAICDEFADEMEDRYEDIADKCYEGEYDEDDIEDLVELLEDTDVDEDDYEEYYSEWQTAFMSKQSYEDALDYMDDGDYSLAASYFELVDERDSNYDDAMEKIGETELLIFDDTAQMIEDWISSSDYDDIYIAFDAIAEKRQVHSDNEDIMERLDELYLMAEDALMSHIRQLLDESRHADARFILEGTNVTDETYNEAYSMIEAGVVVYAQSCVDEYFAEYDFDGAQSCIELLILDYEECSELEEIHANLEAAYVEKALADAQEMASFDFVDNAVEIVQTAMGEIEYGSEGYDRLSKLYAELLDSDTPETETDANAVTFEDGRLYTACDIEVDENGKGIGDASATNLSVVEYNGSKMLKIEVLEQDDDSYQYGVSYKIPKVGFDVDALVGAENVGKIKSFTVDIYQIAVGMYTSEDGTEALCPGTLMGGFGGYSPTTDDPERWVSFGEFAAEELYLDWVHTQFKGMILLDSDRFEAGQTGCTITFMRWGIPNRADIYLDNLTFYDEDGNTIPIIY